MIKVAKFGGSSLADAEHFRKVKAIITADPDRHYVVDSAPGKRYKEDTKVTDLLILAYSNRHDAKAFDKVFKKIENRFNEIIVDLELDFSLDDFESFDISKLRVGKIIFASDADIDGLHIRMLLFLIFYKLFPELLVQGKVFVAQTPLHVINLKNDTSVYCMTDDERNKKIEEIGSYNIKSIDRFKGLGEVNADQLWDTTVNPDTRTLVPLKIDRNDTDIYDVIECLFGKSTDRRKKAILGSMLGSDYDEVMDSIDEMIEYVNNLDLSQVEYEDVTVNA